MKFKKIEKKRIYKTLATFNDSFQWYFFYFKDNLIQLYIKTVSRKTDMTSAAGRLWTDGCLYSVLPHPCQVPLL